MQKKIRIILDSNIFVSYFFGKIFKEQVNKILFDESITLLCSEHLLKEIRGVLLRDKFRNRISLNDIDRIVKTISLRGEFIDVKANFDLVRDKKDNFLINLAIDGKADFLISGDKDLLVLGAVFDTQIVALRDFYQRFYVS